MRTGLVLAATVGLALAACGEPEPAGGALPPASEVTSPSTDVVPTTDVPPTVTPTSSVGPDPSDGPFDSEADIRPDLMVVEPTAAADGQEVVVTFPAGRERGVAYVLEQSIDATWSTTHYLTAATEGYGAEPSWAAVGTEGYGWEDIGISGPGPDRLVIPDSALAGDYRICTANSLENICVELAVVRSDDAAAREAMIVDVYEGVEFYPACGDEQLEHDGVRWYQVQEFEYPEIYDRAVNGSREQAPESAAVHGFARVVAPGPGDAIGTLVVWSDGVAYFVSESGDLRAWLVDDELTYNWTC